MSIPMSAYLIDMRVYIHLPSTCVCSIHVCSIHVCSMHVYLPCHHHLKHTTRQRQGTRVKGKARDDKAAEPTFDVMTTRQQSPPLMS